VVWLKKEGQQRLPDQHISQANRYNLHKAKWQYIIRWTTRDQEKKSAVVRLSFKSSKKV